MKTDIVFGFLSIFFVTILTISTTIFATQDTKTKEVSKLEITVLYKPKDCPEKSKNGQILSMHYNGTLQKDGKAFDSSYSRNELFTFKIGAGQVIQGWEQGLLDMCVGEKRKLIIPPHLGYGASDIGDGLIPPNSTLVFDTELISIQNATATTGKPN